VVDFFSAMKSVISICISLCTMPATLVASQINPVAKVVELLDSLTAKIQKEGEAESKAYKEYVEWCDDASVNKGFEIKTATGEKAGYEAAVSKAAAEATAAASQIEDLAASVATADADLKSATAVRNKEAADFTASESEMVAVVDTLSRAIAVMQREVAKNPAALMQLDTSNLAGVIRSLSTVVDAASFTSTDKRRLVELVQSRESAEDEDSDAPAAAAYKTHSGSIVDVLEDLREKAEEQLSGLRKAEATAQHNFEMLKQSLEGQAAVDAKDLDESKAAKVAATKAKASAEADLAETTKLLEDAKASLETIKADCLQTSSDHDSTVKARAEELKVIAEAKTILVSSTSGAISQSYSFVQFNSQLHTRADLANAEVVTLVRRLSKEHKSPALAQLASRIAAVLRYGTGTGENPFTKVKELISDLITKLESEAKADATEKAYCDEQIAETSVKKVELQNEIEKLSTKIDQARTKSAGLKEDVKQLQAELASLAQQQAEMDKLRMESKDAFVQSKAELEQGLNGIRQAIGVLREYYGGSQPASMLQSGNSLVSMMEAQQPVSPAQFSKASGTGNNIIGILQVVEADFAKNLAAAEAEEADAAAEYEKITQENKMTKTVKDQAVKYKTQEFTALDKTVTELSSDRETVGAELDAVVEYDQKIKERCMAKPEAFEVRKKNREAEIAGLKEALAILEGETALVQVRRHAVKQTFLGA